MSITDETRTLRQELAALAAKPEWDFLARYGLPSKKRPSTLQGRAFRLVRTLLTKIRLLPPDITKYRWLPTLKHGSSASDTRALLIWALGVERDELRRACEGFSLHLQDMPSLAPVLVTDVADFAYFSRLGWLVEYLPELVGEGQSYQERKRAHLAWRYRDAIVLPAAAGLLDKESWNRLLQYFGV